MATNDEIKKKALSELYDARAEHNKRAYTSEREKVIDKMLKDAKAEGYREGQETAQQIFAELDEKLMTRLHKVSDLKKDNPSIIWYIKEKDYNAIKKKHGVKVD